MRVVIPSPLRSYTREAPTVEALGRTVDELTVNLDRSYPGLRFRIIDEQNRIRPHIKLFVNGVQARDLTRALAESDEVVIVCALSGG
jgi:sulfur-carrier protein